MADLVQATPEQVPKIWPLVRDRVTFGVEKSDGRQTVESLYQKAVDGVFDLHLVVDTDEHPDDPVRCVFFTQLWDEDNGERILSMRFLTGKARAEWTWLVMALEAWARQNGADRIEMLVRRGWVRELKEWDYKQTHVLLEKNLKPKAKSDGIKRKAHHDDGHAHAVGGI